MIRISRLVNGFPPVLPGGELIAGVTEVAVVILGDQWGPEAARADVSMMEDQRLLAALGTPVGVAGDRIPIGDDVANGEFHDYVSLVGCMSLRQRKSSDRPLPHEC